MEPAGSVTPGPVRLANLRPFVSLQLLQIHDASLSELMFQQLTERIMKRRQVSRTTLELLAEGLEESVLAQAGVQFDQGAAAIWRRSRVASWAVEGSPFIDVEHELMLCLRRDQLVAVLGPDGVRRAVASWIDKKPPRPPIGRLRPSVINAALLAEGEAKTMWMKNVRGRSASRPDAKTLTGMSLISALDPIGDGNFMLGAARIAIPHHDERQAFTGTVGTTPQQSRVWSRATDSAYEFLMAVSEALELLQVTIDSGIELSSPYQALSSQVDTLAGVRGAYEFRCPLPDDLPGDSTPQDREVAETLERVTINAHADGDGPGVILDVGYDGALAGQLRVAVSMEEGRLRTIVGHHGEGTDPQTVAEIRDLINRIEGHSIHYMSGHSLMNGGVYQVRQEAAPFTAWDFRDLNNYKVTQEKPDGRSEKERRDAIGQPGDRSLFSWVAHTFTDGTLLCDDGSGELADFLHIADDGTLSFIHVKSAGSSSPGRKIAVAKYEVVVSQAVKNLAHRDADQLSARLRASSIMSPAAWSQGKRVMGRQDFLDSLSLREPADALKVIIVQPHITETRLRELRAAPTSSTDADMHRLRLLDTLLNTARISCIGSGADLTVIGAR